MENRLAKLLDMLKAYPDDAFLNYAAGLEYWKQENLADADKHLSHVREQDPEYLATYYQLGKLKQARGEVAIALQIFEEGMAIARKQNASKTLEELQEAWEIAND